MRVLDNVARDLRYAARMLVLVCFGLYGVISSTVARRAARVDPMVALRFE